MSHFEKAVYDAVQAALLDSECHPRAAVQVALRAVAEFADREDVLDTSKLNAAIKDAISHGEAAHRIAELQASVDPESLDDLLAMTKEAWATREQG